MTTFYHVASDKYTGGDLLSWSNLVDEGFVTDADWKWEEAEIGFDGDVICLFKSLSDAKTFQSEYGGKILQINIPEDEMHRLTTVDEGYTAFPYRIPEYMIDAV